eukprot:TRINITY_DN10497_c0_g1_i1.p1 TRINITY_DN10497_c0_g1~~TRINITY_DN10497_c0_g1_i1.p1  ORF type:complete len:225 (+),score=35.53 TRINITY_DN10497_c0_g1_i1:43-675(+)
MSTRKAKRRGAHFKRAGYTPAHPVLIVPGLCSSGLECQAGYVPWVNERIWLSLNKMGFQQVKDRFARRARKTFALVDPFNANPPILPQCAAWVRSDKANATWYPRWLFLNESNHTLYWFKSEERLQRGRAENHLCLRHGTRVLRYSEVERPPREEGGVAFELHSPEVTKLSISSVVSCSYLVHILFLSAKILQLVFFMSCSYFISIFLIP